MIKQKIDRLRAGIEKATEARGIIVDSHLDSELREVVSDQSPSISNSYPKDSFAWIFWENQKRAMSLKDSRSMRWDPLMVRWCLYLRHISGRGYEMMRESGVIKVPSQRTLRDYT